jgi:hypothetical protein
MGPVISDSIVLLRGHPAEPQTPFLRLALPVSPETGTIDLD